MMAKVITGEVLVEELREIIKERILEQGRITFADFMEMALYYPALGYYTSSRPRVGAEGDFFTSSATHPVFAALISLQLEQMWQFLDCPASFTVVEMGAGKGLLAQDILTYLPYLSPHFARSVNYITTERGKSSVLRGTVKELPPQGITGCFLSNELPDAFPVHRVTVRGGCLQEIYVTVEGDNFVEIIGNLSTPRLEKQLSREGITLPEGYCTEVNLNLTSWMEEVAASLEKGFVITIDYGYPAGELYSSERCQGTLMTYYKHTCAGNPYVRIGSQDITTHVDFTSAVLAGEGKGLHRIALLSQREFLLNLGLDVFLRALAEKKLSYREYMANRLAMLELVKEEGMGNFKVLMQSKGITATPLCGITPDSKRKKTLPVNRQAIKVPLLREAHIPLLQGKYPQYADADIDLSDLNKLFGSNRNTKSEKSNDNTNGISQP